MKVDLIKHNIKCNKKVTKEEKREEKRKRKSLNELTRIGNRCKRRYNRGHSDLGNGFYEQLNHATKDEMIEFFKQLGKEIGKPLSINFGVITHDNSSWNMFYIKNISWG